MIEVRDLSHVTLIISDIESSKRFYGDVLGMDQVQTPPGFNPAITWFRKGSAEIHLLHESIAAQPPSDAETHTDTERSIGRARHLAFAVSDVDAAIKTLQDHDVEIKLGPKDRGDGVIQIYCHDPDGHLVELHSS